MVLKCKDCGSYCINWESTRNRCKCGVIEGFFIDEETISVLSVELDKILIWKKDLNVGNLMIRHFLIH
jgi:hypothetical protein